MADDRSTGAKSTGGGGGASDESKNGRSPAESEEIAAMLQKSTLDDGINELGM